MTLPKLPDDPQVATTVVATGVGIFSAAVFMLSRVWRSLTTDRKSNAQENAETGVITLLREEVTRLSNQNAMLMAAIAKLQQEIQELRAENARLDALIAKKEVEDGSQDNPGAH